MVLSEKPSHTPETASPALRRQTNTCWTAERCARSVWGGTLWVGSAGGWGGTAGGATTVACLSPPFQVDVKLALPRDSRLKVQEAVDARLVAGGVTKVRVNARPRKSPQGHRDSWRLLTRHRPPAPPRRRSSWVAWRPTPTTVRLSTRRRQWEGDATAAAHTGRVALPWV